MQVKLYFINESEMNEFFSEGQRMICLSNGAR